MSVSIPYRVSAWKNKKRRCSLSLFNYIIDIYFSYSCFARALFTLFGVYIKVCSYFFCQTPKVFFLVCVLSLLLSQKCKRERLPIVKSFFFFLSVKLYCKSHLLDCVLCGGMDYFFFSLSFFHLHLLFNAIPAYGLSFFPSLAPPSPSPHLESSFLLCPSFLLYLYQLFKGRTICSNLVLDIACSSYFYFLAFS